MKYYVDINAKVSGLGTKDAPFLTISEAADVAVAGDEVMVFPGVYRESVDPKHGGREGKLIVYRSLEPLGAHITGAEPVKNWVKYEKDVWMATVSNALFTDRNPYTTYVSGDWFIAYMKAHTGDVFLNEKSMYEVPTLEEVLNPVRSKASWDPEFSLFQWYTTQDETGENTIFFANFGGLDPNKENVEITARKSCFYPEAEGIGYIKLAGFKVSKAGSQWAPPTAYQEGMIGPHWSKGWIIEDCEIYEAKCSGISLGKYLQPDNDNKWSKWKYKDGTQTERDCICQASYEGWDKEHVGSHIVRRCHIHDCGQTGIVGHLGGVFSIIEDNHIHHINNKQNLAGAEIGGIKMHAAIDVVFRHNHIHDCTRGIWLDWQAQGTRVTGNLFYNNTLPNLKMDEEPAKEMMMGMGEDLFVEVSHGPTLIDNNIFLSARALKLACQGIACVNNIIGGSLACVGNGTDNGAKTLSSPRYTPYHVKHGTQVAGFMTFLHGDARFYNNVFVQQPVHPALKAEEAYLAKHPMGWDDGCVTVGLHRYNGYPTFEEWDKMFEGYCGMGSEPSDRYYSHLPVWVGGNAYFNGARSWEKETDAYIDTKNHVSFAVERIGEQPVLKTNLFELIKDVKKVDVCSEMLGVAFEPEQRFENSDGSDIVFGVLENSCAGEIVIRG